MDDWLVVWNIFLFSHILGISSSQLTKIFQRGGPTTNQMITRGYPMTMEIPIWQSAKHIEQCPHRRRQGPASLGDVTGLESSSRSPTPWWWPPNWPHNPWPIGSVCVVYMLTWQGYIDGKCYHIWHTWSMGMICVLIFPLLTMTDPCMYAIYIHIYIYIWCHEFTIQKYPVMLASIYPTYGSVMGKLLHWYLVSHGFPDMFPWLSHWKKLADFSSWPC